MLSGRGLCDELSIRPGEPYLLCCVVVCDLETSKNEEALAHVGPQRHRDKRNIIFLLPRLLYNLTNKQV
jgi:hypothetical protein